MLPGTVGDLSYHIDTTSHHTFKHRTGQDRLDNKKDLLFKISVRAGGCFQVFHVYCVKPCVFQMNATRARILSLRKFLGRRDMLVEHLACF